MISLTNIWDYGGGKITWKKVGALFVAVTMLLSVLPVFAVGDQGALNQNDKIGINGDIEPLKVNAASKYKKVKVKVKKWYKVNGKYRYRYVYRYKYVKTTSKYKKVRVKKWYKVNGKYRYRYVYRYRSVKAAYSYSTTVTYKVTSGSSYDSIMRSGARYGYCRGVSTASGMMRNGRGDCWAMSEYLCSRLRSAGYTARIKQYATAYSARHRVVQVYLNGKWTAVPYKAYGYNRMFTGS